MSAENTNPRIITIYATKGAKKAKIETAVTTWGELKTLVSKEGYKLNSLHATENVNKADLVNDQAVLPAGEFTIFLRPKQTKSGAERGMGLSYKEIKATIAADIAAHGDVAKNHYNEGKNYTTKGTEELRSLVNSFTPASNSAAPKAEQAEETVNEVPAQETITLTNQDHLDNIKADLTCIIQNAASDDVKERASEILDDLLPGLADAIAEDKNASTTTVETVNVADVVNSVAEAKESAEEEGRRLAREKAQKEEEERLAAEKAEKEEQARLDREESDRLAKEAKELGL